MSEPFHAFLGEREEVFAITPSLVMELERATGAGIGALFKRIIDRTFSFADIVHTIRLGLIGGGMSPEGAARICATYVEPRPLIETFPIALGIVERLWFGAPSKGEANAPA